MKSPEHKVTVYDAGSGDGIFTLFKQVILDFGRGSFLAKRLFIRDIRALYRQSFLGLSWAIIVPIVSTAVWVYLNAKGIVKVETPGVPYPIFVLSGMILWQTFLESLNAPIMSFNAARSILTKINFPREALILAGFYKVLFNLAIKVGLLVALFAYYGFAPNGDIIYALPLIFSVILLGFSIGIFITPIGVLYTDVQRIIQASSQFIFLLSPIIYPFATEGSKALIDKLNPVAVFINVARNTMIKGYDEMLMTPYFIHLAIFSFLLLIGLLIYRMSIPIIVERMGS